MSNLHDITPYDNGELQWRVEHSRILLPLAEAKKRAELMAAIDKEFEYTLAQRAQMIKFFEIKDH